MIKLNKSAKYPYVFINGTLSPTVLRALELETSFVVQNVDIVLRKMKEKAEKENKKPKPWDGRIRLMAQSKNGTYYVPIGLLPRVKKILKWFGVECEESLQFVESDEKLNLKWSGHELRTYQIDAFIEAMKAERCIINLPTGAGKCHGKGTKILMYTGEIKNVEDVCVGEQLMGPDSLPRNVLSLARGIEEMYTVVPIKGESWSCNKSHIISLKSTSTDGKKYTKNKIDNISVENYLKTDKTYKHMMKLWSTGVDFKIHNTEIDPYIVGIWLGDGNKLSPCITNSDPEIIYKLKQFAEENKLKIREQQGNNTTMFHFSAKNYEAENNFLKENHNIFREFIQTCVKNGEKRIPTEYLINNKEMRLNLLAGILDADGYLSHNCYEVITKYNGLKEDILFLARSLGFKAVSSKKIGRIKSCGFEGEYYIINISGETHIIPCIVERKKPQLRKQKKDVLKTGFKLVENGVSEYYGFEIDGDGLYLLGDFTVTHNTLIGTRIIPAIDKPTLILVHRRELMQQWKEAIKNNTGIDATVFDDKNKSFGSVTIAMVQSLHNYLKKESLPIFDVLILDEAHHVPADTFYQVALKCDARYRIGLTATTEREDGSDLYMEAGLGQICISVSAEDLVTQQHLALPLFEFIDVPGTSYTKYAKFQDEYKFGIVLNDTRNRAIAARAKQLIKDGRQVYIHVEQIAHGKLLSDLIQIPFVYSKTKERDEIIDRFRKGEEPAIVSTLLGEGVDIPNIGAIIMAGGRKTKIGTIQKVGRALRPGKEKDAIIVDFIDKGRHLSKHTHERYDAYCEFYGDYVKKFKRR